MNHEIAQRFEQVFAPRIAAQLARQFGAAVTVEVIPRTDRRQPTRVWLSGAPGELGSPWQPYQHPLNVFMTWDSGEIERLMEPDGESRFERYLVALGRKMPAWENARPVDFSSHTQGEPEILLGGLDFEA